MGEGGGGLQPAPPDAQSTSPPSWLHPRSRPAWGAAQPTERRPDPNTHVPQLAAEACWHPATLPRWHRRMIPLLQLLDESVAEN